MDYPLSPESILSAEQEELRKRTREMLNSVREALAAAGADENDRAALAESIRQLDELFLLVIAGEFNAGKSSFVNALLAHDLQEVGVTPTTSRIHLLKYGVETSRALTNEGVVLHTAPVDFLKLINIVDTPGTNAIIREHEALTADFIPRSDLVLFVSSADRPFTESERAFLEKIRSWGKKIVLVVNKTDLLETDEEREKVLSFVRASAQSLIGNTPSVFGVSSRLARRAKSGGTSLWEPSGFGPLEEYIYGTLDDAGRFELKLSNPIGVGRKLLNAQLERTESDLESLEADRQVIDDIEDQMMLYRQDMHRNFKARMGEIDNLLYEMESRGDDYFDDTIRLARIPDLVRKDKMQREFETKVVGDTPEQIETRVSELIDWMVEQDLRQWTAVADHLERRRRTHDDRIIGQAGPREGTLAYDRQRLIDSIGLATRQAVASYNKEREAEQLAESAREAVVSTGIAGAATIAGLGIALAGGIKLAALSLLDVTGLLAGAAGIAFGVFILPNRKRKAKQDLSEKLAELRGTLVTGLQKQFERELRRSVNRIEETIAPYSRFVRAQNSKIEAEQTKFREFTAHLNAIQDELAQLSASETLRMRE